MKSPQYAVAEELNKELKKPAPGETEQTVELMIRDLLKSRASIENLSQNLIRRFKPSVQSGTLSPAGLERLAVFLLYAGQVVTLNELLLVAIQANMRIPWAHFVESLFLSSAAIPQSIKENLLAGAREQKGLNDLARSSMMDHFDETLKNTRLTRPQDLRQRQMHLREELLGKVAVLHSQGLLDQEMPILQRLAKMFPRDLEIQDLIQSRQGRATVSELHWEPRARATWIPLLHYLPEDAGERKILSQISEFMRFEYHQNAPSLADGGQALRRDFAVALMMMDSAQFALDELITEISGPPSADAWLYLEALLMERKFAELSQLTQNLLPAWMEHPDSTLGLMYLRAQALHGLGQTSAALEVLEGLALRHRDYRDTSVLISIWKSESR